jgi:hypothetical protein
MGKWIPSEEQTFAQIGCLLSLTQQVEHCTASLIGTVYPEGKPSWDELEKLGKQTLGGLFRKLQERVDIDPRFQGLLESFLTQRNLFVHNFNRQSWFDVHTETGRDKIWDFLESYQKCLEEIYLVVIATSSKNYDDAGGPKTEFHQKLKETGFLQLIQSYYPKATAALRGRK